MSEILEALKAELKELASQKLSWEIDDCPDYGGNFDDARSAGVDDGEVHLARSLLKRYFPLASLDQAITKRRPEWFHKLGTNEQTEISLSFRGCELAGEAGEACNEIKKLERTRLGMAGGKDDTTDLAKELGDVVICAALVAREAGIDLDTAVREKFNETSDKYGFETKL